MGDMTPTQRASSELAEAVFADPALREQLLGMVAATENREALRDDFNWLPQREAVALGRSHDRNRSEPAAHLP